MSLINDALKRASETPGSPPLPPSETARAFEPAPKPPSQIPIIIFPILLFFILAFAAYFLVRGSLDRERKSALQSVRARQKAAVEPQSEVDPAPTVAVAPAPADPKPSSKTPDVAPPPVVQPKPSPTVAPAVAAAPVANTQLSPSGPLKVQGIFYSLKNPAAVINSKMVHVGDHVGDARVTAIDKDSVTLESDGQKKVLTLF
jgi:hypothetical protein